MALKIWSLRAGLRIGCGKNQPLQVQLLIPINIPPFINGIKNNRVSWKQSLKERRKIICPQRYAIYKIFSNYVFHIHFWLNFYIYFFLTYAFLPPPFSRSAHVVVESGASTPVAWPGVAWKQEMMGRLCEKPLSSLTWQTGKSPHHFQYPWRIPMGFLVYLPTFAWRFLVNVKCM